MAAKGINLTYVPPVIVEGEKIVEILAEDVAKVDEKWAPSMVVYVISSTPSIEAMKRCQGSLSTKPVILYHIDGYFVVTGEICE